ncbi:hypothetical protein [Geminicoccus flavidas]|uniref:hypothetical protein n=1 Tax=Geminicoccus flavidas TaxID=2506407 RepID=UPI001359A14D|nr:hypothetical protein [Geminicoccus flavidas]
MTILLPPAEPVARHRANLSPPRPWPLLPADEVGWLLVEASSRLRASGSSSLAIGPDEATPLGRLAHDPRLQLLASELAGTAQALVRIELGRAGRLSSARAGGPGTLFVELGGDAASRPGRVHASLATLSADALVLAASFRSRLAAAPHSCAPAAADLWPPAAVVAG